MIRALNFSLNLGNTKKLQAIRDLHEKYIVAVNIYLSLMSSQHKYFLSNQEARSHNLNLHIAVRDCAYRQAVIIWKTWRRNKRKGNLPIYKGSMNLDKRFILIQKAKNTKFDYWARISTLEKGKRAVIPFKSYDFANDYFNNWILSTSAKIKINNDGKIFLVLTFRKETPLKKDTGEQIGIDIGIKKLMVDSNGNQYGKKIEDKMDKIQRKQQGSKAFKRALIERDEYINKTVKELPYGELKTIAMEDIKNIKKNMKKEHRLRKEFRSKFQRWTYTRIFDRISQHCEAKGVLFSQVDPAYTSQTCNKCGFVSTLNRNGEMFNCRQCNYKSDADFNASLNILNLSLAQEYLNPGRIGGL